MYLNGRRSMRDFFAILKNRMEERALKNKIGSIELEEKRLLRRFRSETRLLKIKQEQRLGNLSLKRQDSNATHINKASPSPQSPEGKALFTYDKRQSSKSIYVCESFPESDNTSFSTDEECTQLTKRLPRLSSLDDIKTQEPTSPTSNDICQSPFNRKSIPTPPYVSQEIVTSPDKKPSRHDITGSTSESLIPFITEIPRKKSGSPRNRRQTWNGKALPRLQVPSDPAPQRVRSFSHEDQRQGNLCDLTQSSSHDVQIHTDHKKCKDISVNVLKTTGYKPSGLSNMTFPTAEDVQRTKFLSPLNLPIRKASSMNSLKSWGSLPLVSVDENSPSARTSANTNSETDLNEGEAGTRQLPVCGKKANVRQQSSVCHSGPVCLLQRRVRPLSRQGRVVEDASSDIPSESPPESPRAGEGGTGGLRKAPISCKTSLPLNGIEQGQETKIFKNASIKREKLTARSSSLTSQLGHCCKENVTKLETTKTRESDLRSKGKQSSLEAKEEDLPEAMKVKWLNALKKVFNVNLFLSGMVAFQNQRELDRAALEQKQAALEKLYEELKCCRYLRLPSNEDDSTQHDCVSWVFDKDELS